MECWASLSLSDGRPVVAIGGALDLATAEPIRRMLTVILANDPHLILDLRRLTFMDTSGIGLLIHVKQTARTAAGDVILVGLDPRVRRVLAKTNLLPLFTIHDDLAQATLTRPQAPVRYP